MNPVTTQDARLRAVLAECSEEKDARVPAPPQPVYERQPLTASQHILHLLLTVFTLGLWAPVWVIRALAGNTVRKA